MIYCWVTADITLTNNLLKSFMKDPDNGRVSKFNVVGYEYPRWDKYYPENNTTRFVPEEVYRQDFNDVLIFTKSAKTREAKLKFLEKFAKHCQVYCDRRAEEFKERKRTVFIRLPEDVYDDRARIHEILTLDTR